ncbi:e3 ubiquitin-protein ligase ccnb1ip1 [Fusarium langsethiae]|uniref:E3 ubiquitin-protein ligase ccnb1ip1 n=1 Tax=Fusarium langsethiae TaxID=179993 RepID=A0A0N0DEU1_FUSLA|nr:e3 ubiquitin-protein ligase ccnb1ip1 [Fusarium langsethiae]GKU03087.1 unnamed protein product [Fusarium langsethiae]GKU16457.1 unnamed protein product [Fusarium langsethiae]
MSPSSTKVASGGSFHTYKQELINLLAQSQCSLNDPLPSPPLESSFPKSGTPMMGSDSLLELQTSLEADLDSLIGELEFEVPGDQREAKVEGTAMLPLPSIHLQQLSSHHEIFPFSPSIFQLLDQSASLTTFKYIDTFAGLTMEHALTCNNLKCRRELSDRALVTTCSHIFCVECAQRLGITGQEAERRNPCPACESQLTKPDDAVITNLNPSEDYKTSVLSGLSPNIIMECAGRALSFWAYQTTQNIYYQQHLYRTLTEKYSSLGIRLEKTVSDANTEIEGLHHKMSSLVAEQESLRRKHEEISQAYKEKSRKVVQLQELYDKVKRRAELGQIRRAASDAVDHTLQAAQLDPGYSGNMTAQGNIENNPAPAFGQSHRVNVSGMNNGAARNYHNMATEGNQWSRLRGSSHRDISGVPVGGLRRPTMGGSTVHQGTGLPTLTGTSITGFGRSRQSPNNFAPGFINHRGGLAGVGLTSGIKLNVQRSSNDRFEPQTQLVLGVASPSSSSSLLFGGRFPRSIIGPANKTAPVFALIKNRLSVQKQRKLGKMGLLKGSDLRAKFKAREATSEGQDRTSRKQQYLENSTEGRQSNENARQFPRRYMPSPHLGREEREELAKAVMGLELHIEQATIAANMYFHQAHGWEVRSPVPDDLDSLPQMLQGLYTVMIWMQQRIQVYETMFPGLRTEYD